MTAPVLRGTKGSEITFAEMDANFSNLDKEKTTTIDIFSDFVVSGLLSPTSATLASTISAGVAYITGLRTVKAAEAFTYAASVDTYEDISSTGIITRIAVALGAAAPALTANNLRLQKVTTSATAVTTVTLIALLNGTISGMTVGRGGGSVASNTAIGVNALKVNTTGINNTANGVTALQNNTTGINNTAVGFSTGLGITTGAGNTILGANVTGLAAGLTNNIILASGDGVTKLQHNGSAWFGTQLAPAAIDATATATIANLLTQIITSTSAAITNITLPTGTLSDGAFSTSLDMAFNWSVINTGPSAVNILAGVDHTVVGNMAIATLTTSMFRSRRTAANVWVTYRVG